MKANEFRNRKRKYAFSILYVLIGCLLMSVILTTIQKFYQDYRNTIKDARARSLELRERITETHSDINFSLSPQTHPYSFFRIPRTIYVFSTQAD